MCGSSETPACVSRTNHTQVLLVDSDLYFLIYVSELVNTVVYSWVVNYDFGFCLKLKHQLSLFLSRSILWPTGQLIHVGNIISP